MKKTFPLVLFAIFAFLLLGSPERALAQRGGGHGGGGGGFHGGGGGGFHGGGGSFHGAGGSFHGGGGFSGGGSFHGGSGFRGGTGFRGGAGFRGNGWGGRGWGGHGWGGRGWGWGGWGWGWGLGWGWGWPYYWGWPGYGYTYPYGYGYDPGPYYGPSYDPNYDPYYDQQYPPPPARRYRDDRNTNPLPSTNPTNRGDRPPSTPSGDSSLPPGVLSRDYVPSSSARVTQSGSMDRTSVARVTTAAYRSTAPLRSTDASTISASNSQIERAGAPRPEVLNAMRALREMPPNVREREINHGRYSHFSPQEKGMLRNLEP
jgi:hypothetical protein